ncbi:flavodoxin family protein [bacterium]|nr:flavodoxin family protein [bacterium]
MKALVIYDSVYGNTEKIAVAVGRALGLREGEGIVRADDVAPEHLESLELLVVGSPTWRFRPTSAVARFLKSIPKHGLENVRVAAFDTRLSAEKIEAIRILAFFVHIFGFAAKPILKKLMKKGGVPAASPAGFDVADTEGPLIEGELERAAMWAERLNMERTQ